MPSSSSGKWVSRAAATGGGRTYRGQVPVNWYAGLAVIVLLGLVSIVFARHEYQHNSTAAAVQPAVGKTLYAGIAFDVCGKLEGNLTASATNATGGLTTPGEGVIQVSPKTAAEAGNNATLGLFFQEYGHGLSLSATKLGLNAKTTYKNGSVCAKGTPDAGKQGVVKVETWPNVVTTNGTVLTGDPGLYKLAARSLVTVGFVPANSPLKRPSQATINAVIEFSGNVANGTTTTTTTPTTTAPSASTTTTAPTGTTTTTG
jgi:hypothetical protein